MLQHFACHFFALPTAVLHSQIFDDDNSQHGLCMLLISVDTIQKSEYRKVNTQTSQLKKKIEPEWLESQTSVPRVLFKSGLAASIILRDGPVTRLMLQGMQLIHLNYSPFEIWWPLYCSQGYSARQNWCVQIRQALFCPL